MRLPTKEEFEALPIDERRRRMEGLAQTFEHAAHHLREQSARMEKASGSPSKEIN